MCIRDRYGTHLGVDARDYRDCDFTGPTAFVLGAEKWGLTDAARDGMDEALFIPMRGMVQSLNVSVATATLLFEALRQRQAAGLAPTQGEGLTPEHYRQLCSSGPIRRWRPGANGKVAPTQPSVRRGNCWRSCPAT